MGQAADEKAHAMQDFDVIETPENVELERRLAGIGSRFIAGLLDNLILLAAFAALAAALLLTAWSVSAAPSDLAGAGGEWVVATLIAGVFVLYWGYFAFFEMWMNGQTPGKRALKIRVVRQDGGPITFLDIAIRNILRAVDAVGFYGVAGLAMFFTKKAQRLGDLAAGTDVVSEEVPDYSARTDRRGKVRWDGEAGPEALRATGLRPEEYRALANYWARRAELSFEARARLLPNLVRPILQRTGRALADHSLATIEDHVFAILAQAAAAQGRPPPGGPPDALLAEALRGLAAAQGRPPPGGPPVRPPPARARP
jgi:uncharacterized RDD family membrane protein YckC